MNYRDKKSPLGVWAMKKIFTLFRKVAFAEGVSFIILLFVAMPLKYFGDMPKAVTIVGSLHGVLFVALAVLALQVKSEYNKKFNWLVKAGIASLLPFGTFYMEKYWKKEEEAGPEIKDAV